MLRRSDFIAATYALSFVFANFGIAIAARMPMMTTTIRSSISVKPFLLRDILLFLHGVIASCSNSYLVDEYPKTAQRELRRYRRIFSGCGSEEPLRGAFG